MPKKAALYLSECVRSGWLSSEGPFVKRFETDFAKFIDVGHASATSSGTGALHLALMALGVGPGDEVILPAMTIASCYFSIWYLGAKAIPIDVDPATHNINPSSIASKITKKTKVIMVVHLFGHPCDMDPIMELAKKHKLKVLEDAAEAHGAQYKNKKVGSIGDIAIFSFYANKIITTGEGGMVVSNNNKYIEKINKLKSLNHSNIRFVHEGIGHNYLMSNMQAAVGLASLEEVGESIKRKQLMASLYRNGLAIIPGLQLPIEKPWAKNVFWMYAICIDPKITKVSRKLAMTLLQEKYSIQTRTFFFSPRTAFKKLGLYQDLHFPISEEIEKTGLYLPSGLGNTPEEFQRVIDAMNHIFFTRQ